MTNLAYGAQTAQDQAQQEANDFDGFANNFDNQIVEALSVNYPDMAQYLQPDVQFNYEIPAQAALQQQTWAPNDLGVLAPSYVDIPATEARTVRVGPAPEPPVSADLGIYEPPYQSTAGLTGMDYQMKARDIAQQKGEESAADNRDWLVQMGYTDWFPATAAEKAMVNQAGAPFVLKDVTGGGEVYPAVYGAGVRSPIGERGGIQQPGGRYAAPSGNIYQRQAPAGVSYGESPGGLGIFERVPDVSGITDVLPPSGGLPNPPPPAATVPAPPSAVTPPASEIPAPPPVIAGPTPYTSPPPPGEGGATLINTGQGVWWWDGEQWLSSNDRPELTLFADMPAGNYHWSGESGWVAENAPTPEEAVGHPKLGRGFGLIEDGGAAWTPAAEVPTDPVEIIRQVAAEQGISEENQWIPIAIAYGESGLGQSPYGDNGASVGLFHIHDVHGFTEEQRLDSWGNANFAVPRIAAAIADGEAKGLSGYDLFRHAYVTAQAPDMRTPSAERNIERAYTWWNGDTGRSGQAAPYPSEESSGEGSTAAAVYPVEGGTVTARFGEPEPQIAGIRPGATQTGYDFGVPLGSTVRTPVEGEVVWAGPYRGFGTTVIILDNDGLYHQFSHLSIADVNVGDRVGEGQWVARSGNTGISTGAHLGYEVSTSLGSGYIDPSRFIYGRSA